MGKTDYQAKGVMYVPDTARFFLPQGIEEETASHQSAVQLAIETELDSGLPEVYDRAIYARKTTAVFEHVFSSYQGSGKSVYDAA